MSEYWKSLPRKFCDICKCWFADNKASIEFHERGKRHKENAAKRIQDIQKKGIKEAKKKQKLEDDMAKIEKAALAAYKKDLQNQVGTCLLTDVVEKLSNSTQKPVVSKPNFKKSKNFKIKTVEKEKKTDQQVSTSASKVWYEAVTEEGHKYYWNTENSESQWDPPSEGFVSIEEQNQLTSQNNIQVQSTETENEQVQSTETENEEVQSTETEKEEVQSTEMKKEQSIKDNIKIFKSKEVVGPQPKVDPYGQWVTIVHKEPVEIDLQLPKPSEDVVEVVIPVAKDEPKLRIKEKVVGQLNDADSSEEVTFKKRKFIGSSKRNTRQRTTEDD